MSEKLPAFYNSLHSVSFCFDVFKNVTNSQHVLLHDRLNPRIFFHLKHWLVTVKLQICNLRWDDGQTVVLNMKFTKAVELSNLTWEFQQIVVAQSKLEFLSKVLSSRELLWIFNSIYEEKVEMKSDYIKIWFSGRQFLFELLCL